jgi:hypothetical protein|tara:strand:- start:975 stop:1343 length:369 start_codon:yes stop_codon:yes gene_type:complete
MAAGIYNFTIEQGTTVVKQFTYKDANAKVVDLSGYDVRMQIRDTVASSTVVDTFTTSSGLSILATAESTASGTIQLRIEAASSSLYTFITAVYDIEIEDNGSPRTVTRLLQGSIKLSPEVTR